VAVVFHFVVAAPRFFSGAIQLGGLMQIASAFDRVQEALSWFVENYDHLATWRATTDRLIRLKDSIVVLEHTKPAQAATDSIALQVDDLSVASPTGVMLLADATLLRTLAYPNPASDYSDAALKEALNHALLLKLVDYLNVAKAWGQQLSGGEQQRLALIHVFLKQPRWMKRLIARSSLIPASLRISGFDVKAQAQTLTDFINTDKRPTDARALIFLSDV
jgi:putative ATP-binding cassette transporter